MQVHWPSQCVSAVCAGSLAQSVCDHYVGLAGAAGGCYAIVFGHIVGMIAVSESVCLSLFLTVPLYGFVSMTTLCVPLCVRACVRVCECVS